MDGLATTSVAGAGNADSSPLEQTFLLPPQALLSDADHDDHDHDDHHDDHDDDDVLVLHRSSFF